MELNKKYLKYFIFFFLLVVLPLSISSAELEPGGVEVPQKIIKTDVNGKVDYDKDIISKYGSLQLREAIDIQPHKISVDSQTYPELNVPATITFYNINMDNPQVFYNGEWQPNANLRKISSKTYELKVDGFSTWELIDSTFNGTFNQTELEGDGDLRRESDAVGIWHFTADATDSSNSSNDGTVNGATWVNATKGYYGGAYEFDGVNDYINMSNGLIPQEEITISTWIKLANEASDPRMAISKHNAYKIQADTNGIRFITYVGGVQKKTSYFNSEPNIWYHVVGVSNGTNNLLYINGQLENTSLSGTIDNTSNYDLLIGSDSYSPTGRVMNGTIDEVMIIPKALTSTEIQRIYNDTPNRAWGTSQYETNTLTKFTDWDMESEDTSDWTGVNNAI